MGRESSVMGDEFELSLELSIGGCYAKSENKNLEREKGADDESNLEISRSDFSINDVGCELSDPMRKREIRALKRKEARMKREVKQSRGLNSVGLVEVEERDGNGIPEESAAKREKIDAENSNMSRLMQAQFPLPIGSGFAYPWKSSVDEPEQPSSSVVSHHRSTCTSHRGGSSSDSGSHSNSFGTHQNQQGSKIEYVEVNNSSSQSNTTKVVQGSMVKKRVLSNLTDNTCSSTQKPSLPPTSSIAKLPNPSQIDASTTRMPRVTTTGNGPNGKTIQGLLYKYAESEVSIMCVCHGRFFSPAQFVEHAGGVDVTHPLRHITVDPGTVKR